MQIIAGLKPYDLRVINVTLEDVPKVAVLFSGGMDSTLLLSMLIKDKEMKKLNTEIHCFTATQVGTKKHAMNVLELSEFKNKVVHHIDVHNPISESVKPVFQRLLDENWILYGGTNAVPLESIGGRYPPRPVKHPDNPSLHLPFVFLFKYHILDAYYQLGIEHILPTTHTCTEQIDGECGLCYACLEKQWAFNKLK